MKVPIVTLMAQRGSSPFEILISTLISLRTKDQTTALVSKNLFSRASTPEKLVQIPLSELEEIVKPAGFYKRKAIQIHDISQRLISEFNGQVPDDLDTLLTFKGVGRKTANLVVIEAFGKSGICVDTHVHQISNRWGYVTTKTPDDTELVLRKKLPREYWMEYNTLLVAFGQGLCTPINPWCSKCKIAQYCEKNGVLKKR